MYEQWCVPERKATMIKLDKNKTDYSGLCFVSLCGAMRRTGFATSESNGETSERASLKLR